MRSGRPRSARTSSKSDRKPATQPIAHRIFGLWQRWQDGPSVKPALDRWLRQSLRDEEPELRKTLTNAMMTALRFQQWAVACELLLKDANADLERFDERWHTTDLNSISPIHFWYWIELRSDQRWDMVRHVNQNAERIALFEHVKHIAEQHPLSPWGMMWHGLRPSWRAALEQRAKVSQWSNEELLQFVALQCERPPLWLRLNPLRKNPLRQETQQQWLNDVQQQLQQESIHVQQREGQLCAFGGRAITQSALFEDGIIEVQDLASQHIALAVNAQPGEKIWDMCAGAGGKTLAMAAPMNHKGSLYATDIHQYKLDELKRRASRAGVRNVRSFTWDSTQALRLPMEVARQGGFDKILIDAPCSATGTWRRNPDARWKLSDQHLQELLTLQRHLLTQALPALRAEGTLVYATCSWLVEENEAQVQAFAADHQLVIDSMRLLGAPLVDSDTMFVAVLRRA